jgi:DNA-binding transcriptional LysR family regulator
MDLADLAIFKAVAEEGGIVRAARKLHRVQSSVTSRIQQLEASVGTQLFLRSKQRLHLSSSGKVLLAYADKLLGLAEEARNAVADGPPRGVLKLGALESTTASRLPAVFCAFHKRFPDVRIELMTGTNDALVAAVTERRLDAAFVAVAPSRAELAHAAVYKERLVLITSLAHAPVKRAADVANDSVISFPRGCAYRRVLERWLGDKDLASVRVLELGSYHAIVACVAAGAGIAIVPQSVLATVQSDLVAIHSLPKVLSDVSTPLIWRSGEQTPPVVALRELMRTVSSTSGRPPHSRAEAKPPPGALRDPAAASPSGSH